SLRGDVRTAPEPILPEPLTDPSGNRAGLLENAPTEADVPDRRPRPAFGGQEPAEASSSRDDARGRTRGREPDAETTPDRMHRPPGPPRPGDGGRPGGPCGTRPAEHRADPDGRSTLRRAVLDAEGSVAPRAARRYVPRRVRPEPAVLPLPCHDPDGPR